MQEEGASSDTNRPNLLSTQKSQLEQWLEWWENKVASSTGWPKAPLVYLKVYLQFTYSFPLVHL